MFQTPAHIGSLTLDAELQSFIGDARLDAARAFRVLRDVGQVQPAAELDFILRAPGGRLVRLGHPGLWSVSLEPAVTVFDPHGNLVSVQRGARAPAEEFIDLFQRREDLTAIVRFSSPHLDAWARGGRSLPFAHLPLVRATNHQGLAVYQYGSAAAALEPALRNNYAGVVHEKGGAVLAGSSVIQLTELAILAEQAARVELLAGAWRQAEDGQREPAHAGALLSWV